MKQVSGNNNAISVPLTTSSAGSMEMASDSSPKYSLDPTYISSKTKMPSGYPSCSEHSMNQVTLAHIKIQST